MTDTKALDLLIDRNNWFRDYFEDDWSWRLDQDPPLFEASTELADLRSDLEEAIMLLREVDNDEEEDWDWQAVRTFLRHHPKDGVK